MANQRMTLTKKLTVGMFCTIGFLALMFSASTGGQALSDVSFSVGLILVMVGIVCGFHWKAEVRNG